ncbi:MAG: heme-binding beta-barrel domain-containing protein [bacterium]|nr:DUF1794 domain-containing protein [Gammaproteobacteria bacterium]
MSDEVNYGPLTALIGTWKGHMGTDISPEPDGIENNPYYETIIFTSIGDVENAETQELTALHYRQVVSRKSDDKVFHDETGYWMWDETNDVVMHSLTIPRGVCLLAGGKAEDTSDGILLEVSAGQDDPDWRIIQSPFMRENASTIEFRHTLTVRGDRLSYKETIVLDIYGRRFEHTDENELTRQ